MQIELEKERRHAVSSLRTNLEEFLLYGPQSLASLNDFQTPMQITSFSSHDERNENLQTLKEESLQHMEESSTFLKPIFQQLSSKCSNMKEKLDHFQPLIEQNEIISNKMRSYFKLKYKIQCLCISKALVNLAETQNILQLPTIIIEITQLCQFPIFERSRLFQFMMQVIKWKKEKLLLNFHQLFEEQLDAEIISNNNNNNEDDVNIISDQKEMWLKFLERARSWLLSYALICILPGSLLRNASRIVQAFSLALDDALTPLWGRFYHHLKLGRESFSSNQIVWTFKYATSFLDMLHNLCRHMTTTNQMQQFATLHHMNFAILAEKQVIDKAIVFLQAHVAGIFVAWSRWEDDFGLQLIDELIEFDHYLERYAPDLFLSHVIYDSKVIFHEWLMCERSLLLRQLQETICSKLDSAFDLQFKQHNALLLEEETEFEFKENPSFFASPDQFQCYKSIYEILQLIVLASQRYAHFPFPAQSILSEVILEPLLCLSLGLFIYRIRTDQVLFDLSQGKSPLNQSGITIAQEDLDELKKHLIDFRRSIEYFQTAIGHSTICNKQIFADGKRCKKRWTILQDWLPKLFIHTQLQNEGYGLQDLVKTAMKISDKYTNHNAFAYRSEITQFKPKSSSAATDTIEDDSFGACIVMTRGLLITVLEFLEQHIPKKS
jgi:hypothetical protein